MEPLRIGAWCLDPSSGVISKNGTTARLDARAMRLLLCLAEHPGEVVSIDVLLEQVWPDVVVTQDSVYQAIASLRRLLGDDAKEPAYIATVPRLGYRMVAEVGHAAKPRRQRPFVWTAVAAVLCIGAIAAFLMFHHGAARKSIAVLPFVDLTTDMNEGPFADGMTEELIDRLSRVPGIRVPGSTSSFFFRGKRIAVPDVARTLGVAYLLAGSVRKSGARLRVSARLIRADGGDVVWSHSYDRPFGDILAIQDDIATQVTTALRASALR